MQDATTNPAQIISAFFFQLILLHNQLLHQTAAVRGRETRVVQMMASS
jgi:hypothetical protein